MKNYKDNQSSRKGKSKGENGNRVGRSTRDYTLKKRECQKVFSAEEMAYAPPLRTVVCNITSEGISRIFKKKRKKQPGLCFILFSSQVEGYRQ